MEKSKEFGALQIVWLVLMLVSNAFIAAFYLSAAKLIQSFTPILSLSVIYLFGAIGIINFVLVIFLLKKKKWAFFGLLFSAGIVFAINTKVVGLNIVSAVIGLIGILILYLILRPKWDLLE